MVRADHDPSDLERLTSCGYPMPGARIVADDPRVEQVLIPLRDGVTLIRRARVREQPS